jgi:serine protein kinase
MSPSGKDAMVATIAALQNYELYRDLSWEGSFEEYLHLVRKNPKVTRNAFQRAYDMVLSYGSEEYVDNKKKILRYNFFQDPDDQGADAVFGLDIPLGRLMNVLKAAARGYGPEKRVILLHGPVGSSKSTIARLLKKGLERYSASPGGALYTFRWTNLREYNLAGKEVDTFDSPMHEEPLRLIPPEWRKDAILKLGLSSDKFQVKVDGELDPASRFIFGELMKIYKGNWQEVVEKHIVVRRLILSEKDRIGIGTFQPKDEKNQDSTELTGDINYRKIAEYGSDSDPRAFNFDGEFNIANRGVIEFVEVLKLDVAFLYDLLGASQEHRIKPKKFAQTDIDELISGHTNEAEYNRLLNNEFMEALRGRTIKIDIP